MIAAEESQQLSPEQTRQADRTPLEALDPNEEVTMSVMVRRNMDSLRLSSAKEADDLAAGHRRYLSRGEVARMFDADLDYVAQWSRKHGLTVVEANPAQRLLVLKGTMGQIRGFAKVEPSVSRAH